MAITAEQVKQLARECGFELAGLTPAVSHDDFSRFSHWRAAGCAGEMTYLTDQRGDLRSDPRHLLPQAQTILCVGKLYNTPHPHTNTDPVTGWISRYAWGADYHEILRADLVRLASRIRDVHGEHFEWRACVDTAPLLERSYAHAAGLGWIGRNTCLINQEKGSWFFLAELLLSLPLSVDVPVPDRCGTCRRCIDSCPTDALVPDESGGWRLDARLCISYLTIEKRGPLSQGEDQLIQNQIFGCDICQDVCPWNRRESITADPRFEKMEAPSDLPALSQLTAAEFRALFRQSPVWRAKYEGFLRNVAAAMGNSGQPSLAEPLHKLKNHPHPVVSQAAQQALDTLNSYLEFRGSPQSRDDSRDNQR